jgi:hypothetical protein
MNFSIFNVWFSRFQQIVDLLCFIKYCFIFIIYFIGIINNLLVEIKINFILFEGEKILFFIEIIYYLTKNIFQKFIYL